MMCMPVKMCACVCVCVCVCVCGCVCCVLCVQWVCSKWARLVNKVHVEVSIVSSDDARNLQHPLWRNDVFAQTPSFALGYWWGLAIIHAEIVRITLTQLDPFPRGLQREKTAHVFSL